MSDIWAATITVDGDIEFLTTKPGYPVLRDAVGGLIAPVGCPHGDTVYVNDEGLLMGLYPNMGAMLVSQYPGPLVGDAIVCGPLDDEGDHLPLSAPVVAFLRRLAA
jgi:hypothetical protein